MSIRSLILAAALVFAAPAAHAKDWIVDYANSKLEFIGKEGDKAFTGTFKKFAVTVDFDPAKPEAGKISAIIDTGSATTGNGERDEYLPQPEWFAVKQFPEANFISSTIHKTAAGFSADGTLTIKGMSHPVTLNFTLSPEDDHTRVKGEAALIRTDFKLGEGDWMNENYVKFAVTIAVNLAAKPAP